MLSKEWISRWLARETATSTERILSRHSSHQSVARLLFDNATTRLLEQSASLVLRPHSLMQRAGLAVARLAMAIAPHANVIWIPCGPGNNGGDGYEAARHLRLWGKCPVVTSLGNTMHLPKDADAARKGALEAGVCFSDSMPNQYDLCIDALFGIGRIRPFDATCSAWIQHINYCPAPVLAIDVPSGLDADTGSGGSLCINADVTLSLLTLKPGLFTADGREASGDVWFDDLGIAQPTSAYAQLGGPLLPPSRAHNTHKGSYGDVTIIGGSPGMTGAALLAGRAALHGGAGRVYVSLLDCAALALDIGQTELMFRPLSELAYKSMTVVAGCGGGQAIASHLADILDHSDRLVLDADALNAIAQDTTLQDRLRARRVGATVLTPHPLEAAHLLKLETHAVQANRLSAAQALADRFGCTIVLKGSGSIIAAPGVVPHINPSGNARLASAGTGDVLAGLIGARLAAGGEIFHSTCESVYRHGAIADTWPQRNTLTAQGLARAL